MKNWHIEPTSECLTARYQAWGERLPSENSELINKLFRGHYEKQTSTQTSKTSA